MKKILLITLFTVVMISNAVSAMKYRGIVYDVGLQYNPDEYSVETYNDSIVKYDMKVIADSLHCNAVRIEGEDIKRLVAASEIASENGLKVFFNPWWMNATAEQVIPYMAEAAKAAEELREKGLDITFVAGCEFSLFNKGIFDGNSVNERIKSMINFLFPEMNEESKQKSIDSVVGKLNTILAEIVEGVRANFKGEVTYSAGTWEPVDWSIFDIVGVDYYRMKETDDEYLNGIQKYMNHGKPVWVMEVGCCAFEGAADLGSGAFAVCQGVDENGNGIYAGGIPPRRSEKEQADYDERQIRILNNSGIEGMFIFEFSFPIAPYRESGLDSDLTAYPIVKSFPKDDPRSMKMPPWEPKEAFYRVSSVYRELQENHN